MNKRLLILLAAVAAVVALAGGCSSEPCLEAADKLERCLERLDCRDQDPISISKCRTAVDEGNAAVELFRETTCAAQLKDKAEEINRCPIDQVDFCNCFVL